MALGESACLAGRFAAARRLIQSWRLGPRAVGTSYQGFVKALIQVSPRLWRALADHLRAQIPAVAGPHWKLGRWVVLGVDGSKFNLPRTASLRARFGASGKRGSAPQAYLTTILHLTTGLPWDARIGRGDASERAHLRRMLRSLPAAALLVADAGFVGYELWSLLCQRRVHFLIRVGANVRLLTQLGYAVREYDGLVYLWPDRERRAGRAPLVLRRIRLREGDREMTLVTNVLDAKALTDRQAAECYHLRWGIELWYRQLKQTAARRQLASRAPTSATLELAWLVVAMALLGLLGVREAVHRGRDPRKLSPAGTLQVLRTLAVRPACRGGLRTLRRMLGGCVQDTYVRHAAKDRVRWAAKRGQSPPGRPAITTATETQVLAAAKLPRPTPAP
jgi:hypothetical protein